MHSGVIEWCSADSAGERTVVFFPWLNDLMVMRLDDLIYVASLLRYDVRSTKTTFTVAVISIEENESFGSDDTTFRIPYTNCVVHANRS